MIKWIIGIIAVIILLVGLFLTWLLWLAAAYDLQKNLEDNLTLLKRDLIFEDRDLSFTYQDGGVEMKWLQPSYTLIQPMVIYNKGNDEYRFTADEITFHGSFSGNEVVTVKSPETIQMAHNSPNGQARVVKLKFEEILALELHSPEGEGYLWHHYQLPKNQSGTIVIHEGDKIEGRLRYDFYKMPPRNIIAPYSPHLDKVIQKIETLLK